MPGLDWSQFPAVGSAPGRVRGAWVLGGTRIDYGIKDAPGIFLSSVARTAPFTFAS